MSLFHRHEWLLVQVEHISLTMTIHGDRDDCTLLHYQCSKDRNHTKQQQRRGHLKIEAKGTWQ